jgi:hypothetical protein
MEDHEHTHPSGIGRRTILRATAWSVPAIVLATSAPARAVVSGQGLVFTASDVDDTDEVNVKTLAVTYAYDSPDTSAWSLTIIVSPEGAATFEGALAFSPDTGASGAIELVGTLTLTELSTGSATVFVRATRDGVIVDSPAAPLPPFAADETNPEGSVPIEFLVISAAQLSTSGGGQGPLRWPGGQVRYDGPAGGPETAIVGYRLELVHDPGGGEIVLRERVGTAVIDASATGQVKQLPNIDLVWGDEPDEPLEPGDYFVRMTVYGSDGSLTDVSNTETIA